MKAKRLITTPKRYLQKLAQLDLNCIWPIESVAPAFRPDEDADARYAAMEICKQLEDPEKKGSIRHRILVSVYLFKMTLGAQIEFVKRLMAKEKEYRAAKALPQGSFVGLEETASPSAELVVVDESSELRPEVLKDLAAAQAPEPSFYAEPEQ
jgi:hypothetical protein